MLTQFGKFCRKLRIDNDELLKDMADKLEVTSSYLSAVENGKRNVPQDWFDKIVDLYSLDEEVAGNLRVIIQESQNVVKMDIKNFNSQERSIAMSFAREFKELDEAEKSKIWDILQKHNRGSV